VRLRRRSSLICLLLGLVTVIPVRMIVGVVVGLGGLVQMGSSVGSTNQLELSLNQTEDERNAASTPWSSSIPETGPVRIPIHSGHRFRFDVGRHSDLKPATVPK
jgi:hypothetical protein